MHDTLPVLQAVQWIESALFLAAWGLIVGTAVFIFYKTATFSFEDINKREEQ
tara:strand:+ start:888 stop:1043 length:156 start_codon:yes stop_codon:yes gene_type:complete